MRIFLLFLVSSIATASAQTPGTCDTGEASGTLDVGGVRTTMQATSVLFTRPVNSNSYNSGLYDVPSTGDVGTFNLVSIWVGGFIDGEPRVSGSFGPNAFLAEFWPGPLNPGGTLPDASDCSAFDRVWVTSEADIRAYEQSGTASSDLAEWPVGLGAPAVDASGVPIVPSSRDQRLDLASGERPSLLGQQSAFWVLNDVGNQHGYLRGNPIGIEVRVLAGAFLAPNTPALHLATAYRFEVINRSERVIEDVRVGLLADLDIGGFTDDYVGSDSLRGLAYQYNADNDDVGGYGPNPPASGIDLLSGAHSVTYAPNRSLLSEGYVNSVVEASRQLRGLWPEGIPMTMNGDGANDGGQTTKWAFPGRAETGEFWSETDALSDTGRQPTEPGDRYSFISSEALTLAPGESHAVDAAFLFARGGGNYTSITRLREASTSVQARYDADLLFPARVRPVTAESTPPTSALALSVSPNPTASRAAVTFALAAPADVRVTLVDVLGRTVRVLADGVRQSGEHRVEAGLAGLAAGVYRVVAEANGERSSVPLTVTR